MVRFLFLFSSIFLLLPFSIANEMISDLAVDPRVQQFAEDLMKRQYSYDQAFKIATSEAYQCINGNVHPNSKICQSYGFWK